MKIKNNKKEGILYRSAEIDKSSIDFENRTLKLTFASNNPCDRGEYKEVLRVDTQSIRTKRLDNVMSLLYNHNPDDLLGRVLDYKIENNKAYATVQLGSTERCKEAFTLASEGILVNTSFMYRVFEVIKIDDIDGSPAYEVTDYEPLEISLVTIPADEITGVGRSYKRSDDLQLLDINDYLEDNTDININTKSEAELNNEENKIQEQKLIDEQLEAEKLRALELEKQKEQAEKEAIEAQKLIDEKLEAEQRSIAEEAEKEKEKQHLTIMTTNEDNKKMKKITITEIAKGLMTGDSSIREYNEKAQDYARSVGQPVSGGFMICSNDIATRAGEFIQSEASSGGNLVAENYHPEMLVNVIQNKTTLKEAGVDFINASGGNLIIPTASVSGTAAWAGEIEDATQVSFGSDQIESLQKRLSAYVDVSKSLIWNGSVDVNKLVQDIIAEQFAVKLDYTAYQGAGTTKIPLGILNNSAVQAVALSATPTRANILEMIKKLEKSNMGATCFVMSPEMKYLLSLVDIGTAGNRFLFDEFTNQVAGYRTVISNNVPDTKLILSNWSDIKVVDYGMLDITVDNITKAGQNLVRITFNGFYDIVHTRPTNTVVGTKA